MTLSATDVTWKCDEDPEMDWRCSLVLEEGEVSNWLAADLNCLWGREVGDVSAYV